MTIVFADLIGSTALHERLDAESARRVMDGYYRALRTAVDSHGGTVVKLLGDGVMAAFGVPRVAEDDAIRAVRAAVAMQRAFRDLVHAPIAAADDIGLRVAVNTGEVVVSDDHADVVGDPVNVAARLQQEAHDGDVLIGESTRRLVSHLVTLAPFGDLTLKGRSETVAAYRVVSLERPAGAAATAFVGRDAELRRIRVVYDAAVSTRGARLAVLLGSPGLGKSRMLDEFARRLGDRATVLAARCDAAGGATFAPLAGALRALLRLDDSVSGEALRAAIDTAMPSDESEPARISGGISALLAGTPAAPEETFFVVRRYLAGLTAAQPVVLAIDDVQWAEPLLLDLVEHLVQWSSNVPLFVLVAARPELRDTRASLATPGGLVAEVVTLGGLDASAAARLAANVIGAGELPAAIAGRVLATSEGNPLFVGELVRMLVQDGALKQEGDGWVATIELAGLEMPPTIQALLAARIERLRPEERTVLERAAVVGRHFSRAAVAQLLPREEIDLDARLESLRRSELIEPDTGWFLGEPGLRFHHVLIRDAAYRRLLKGTRAELHRRFADWLETRVGEAVEHEETIGWHLEQAHQHLRELGPIDVPGRVMGERAARYLATAGRRALARDDLPLAASLLGRALDRLDAADPARADLALDWCEALLAAGDVGPAAQAIAELGRFAGASARLRAWHTCFNGQLAVLTDPQALRTTADAVAAAADELATAGDAAGEAKGHSVHALALARLGKIGACEAALDKALAAARRAQDRRRANAVLAGAPLAALWGPSPVTRASGRCLDVVRVLRITQGAPAVEAVALRCQGVLEALRGRTDAARRMIASSRRMVEELGITQGLLEADVFAGHIELLEGDAVAAERWLRSAYDGLRSHGLGIDAAQAAALLGRALLAQGRAEEAEALSHDSEALAGDDLKAAIAWRGVRAEALARRGEHAAAVDLARAAVDIAATTDALLDHAEARLTLATALRAAGRSDDADAEEARAIELWEAKGATLLVERARRNASHGDAALVGIDAREGEPRGEPSDGRSGSAGTLSAQLLSPGRRVPPTTATAMTAGFEAAVASRDTDALDALWSDALEVIDNPTGASYGREGHLASIHRLLRGRDPNVAIEPLATLGESLSLCRRWISASGTGSDRFDVGKYEREEIVLFEVDGRGRCRRLEIFAIDRLGEAVARLYERYADLLPDGPTRARAAATARSVALLLGPFDLDRWAAAIAPAIDFADHRRIGIEPSRGAEAWLRGLRSLFEIAEDLANRVDDVLSLRSDALLLRWANFGRDRASGGAYERHFLWRAVFGSDGLMTHIDLFEVEREAEALAGFDALSAGAPAVRFANAASRAVERYELCWRERDWDGMVASFAPTLVLDDRRPLVHLQVAGEDFFANQRFLFAMQSSQWRSHVLATRGERLVLCRTQFTGEVGAGGQIVVEILSLVEVDASGRYAVLIVFDADDLDAAYAELDTRYAMQAADSGRAALTRAFTDAFARRDWDAVATLLAPDLIVNDHRLLGWETLHGPAAYIRALESLIDLAPDVRLRIDHLTMSPPWFLYVTTWLGTRDGGRFETPSVMLCELDAQARIRRFDQYDLAQLEEAKTQFAASRASTAGAPLAEFVRSTAATAALARVAELRPDPLRIPPNAATRAADRVGEARQARDWDALEALAAPVMVLDDRRRAMLTTGAREMFIAMHRFVGSHDARSTRTVLATSGDRLGLEHVLWTGPDQGPAFEAEALQLLEVDAEGRIVAVVVFDPDNRRAASLEMYDRYFRGEGAQSTPPAQIEFVRAMNAHDLDRARAALPDDFVFHDHRRTGIGRIAIADDYIASLAAVYEQSPDMVTDTLYHVAVDQHGSLTVGRMFGTLVDGGAFESVFVRLNVYRNGRGVAAELFEIEDLELARARFEELRPDPLRMPADPASHDCDR